MKDRLKWAERKFSFDIPPGWMSNTIERLRGVAPRLLDMLSSITEESAQTRFSNKWSIKEHIGHLGDLEELWMQRVRDFSDRKPILTAADMSNAQTEKSGHNKAGLQELIQTFLSKRERYISMLKALDSEAQEFQSLHPRLQVPVRAVDMAFFAAEHDDHHLASMREIMELV